MIGGIFIVGWFLSTANTFTVAATKVDDSVGTMDQYSTIVYSGIRANDDIDDILSSDQDGDFPTINLPQQDKIYLSDIRNAYFDKGSDVVTLDLVSIQKSEKPVIYYAGNKKIGFFYIDQYTSSSALKKITFDLRKDKVDVVICITKRSLMLGSFDDIDCVLCIEEKSPSETSEGHVGNCLITRAAEIGSIGALNISSSNVVSDKTYSVSSKPTSSKS